MLITGGAGFIGSYICLVLLEADHELVVLDNYANSSPEALRRVVELAKTGAEGLLQVIESDIRRRVDLEQSFEAGASTGAGVESVIHFAGLKTVGESVAEPLSYQLTEGGIESIESLIGQFPDPPQRMDGWNSLLDRDVRKQRAAALPVASHLRWASFPIFAGLNEFFSKLLKRPN